jgi:thiamine-monophosphate kinase
VRGVAEDDVVAAIRAEFAAVGAHAEPEDADAWRIDQLLATHATTDAVVEGVDFDRALYPLSYAGHRALAQNLSDLYAVDAEPGGFVWSLAIPTDDEHREGKGNDPDGKRPALPRWSLDDVRAFARGAARLAAAVGCPLLGGDLSSTTGPLVGSITCFGRAGGLTVARSGARPGQGIWLTRRLGASARGLRLLQAARVGADDGIFHRWLRGLPAPEQRAVRAHVEPAPFHGLECLSDYGVAAIDVSDGLARDAARLARTSGVAIELDRLDDAVDVAAGASVDDALHGGEDWALLFAVPDGLVPPGCVRIGHARAGQGLTAGGVPVVGRGFDHFR